eukprot:Nitzschia sp. Nitz4//scaffold31_size150131//32458//36173//NITZ4_002814-RA/size150131-augustus-gene-0.135-mRNA-1//-1//CDS//3329547617//9438//frame0
MPFLPPPPSITPPQLPSSKAVAPMPPIPADSIASTEELSPGDEELVQKYRKMLKMGMPEGAVINKMSMDKVEQRIQDLVFKAEPESSSVEESSEPPTETENEEVKASSTPEPANEISDDDIKSAERYKRMLRMGMPESAVASKMRIDGTGSHIQQLVFPPDQPVAREEPIPRTTPSLSSEDDETAESYRKMLRVGIPEAEVARKMTLYGVDQHIQDAVLAPSREETTEDSPATPKSALNEEEECIAEKYRKMVRMGMPEGAVANKMAIDGIQQHIQDAVVKLSPEDLEHEVEQDESEDEEDTDDDATNDDPEILDQVRVLTPDEEEAFQKYKKMLKMGMPEGAISQKMSADGISQHIQDIVLAQEPSEESHVDTDTTEDYTAEEENLVKKYRKMLLMGMPEGAVANKMNMDNIDQKVQEAVLAKSESISPSSQGPEQTPGPLTPEDELIAEKYRKMLKMGMSAGAVSQKMEADDVPHHVRENILDPSLDQDDSSYEAEGPLDEDTGTLIRPNTVSMVTRQENEEDAEVDEIEKIEEVEEDIEEDEDFEEFEDEDNENDNVGDEPQEDSVYEDEEVLEFDESESTEDLQHLLTISNSQHQPQSPDGEYSREQVAVGALSRESRDNFEDEPINGAGCDEEMGSAGLMTKAEYPPRNRVVRSNPDGFFHRMVFLAYILMVGGAVAVCLVFLLGDDDTESQQITSYFTTTMDSVNIGTCDFTNSVQPHVIDQCRCLGEISILADDIRERYDYHRENFIPLLYESYDEVISSCTVRNQALVWLASANDSQFSDVLRSERFALANIFIGTGGESWVQSANWLSSQSACNWFGSTCIDGRIEALTLSANNAVGELPAEIVILEKLVLFSFSRNQIEGEIPQEIFFSPNLTGLYLNDNQLSGSIPDTVFEATFLEDFDMSNNKLSGTIPMAIANLSYLMALNIANNSITGTIPSVLFSLPLLQDLQVGYNGISGSLPVSVSMATSLRLLSLSQNMITGSIPQSIVSLTNIEHLIVQNTSLAGSLPDSFNNMSNLIELVVSESRITGSIPTSLGALTQLVILKLDHNQLDGTLPDELQMLQKIGKLLLLHDTVPKCVSDQVKTETVESLDLSFNSISGSVPNEFGLMTSLVELYLNDNDLTGEVPTTLAKLLNLESLILDGNIIQGSMPAEVCSLRDAVLQDLIVDCAGMICDIPSCCTSCRE